MDANTFVSSTVYVNPRVFMAIHIDKYVPKTIEKDHMKKKLLLELEKCRRKECEFNGKKSFI